jgi:hypothetical protein
MTAQLRAGLAAATLAAAAMLACGDPLGPEARFETYADTVALYALNGAPRGAPTAIRIIAGAAGGTAAVFTDAAFGIDVAVDIDEQGRPRLYPVRDIASPLIGLFSPTAAPHQVGIQRTTDAFDDIARAPNNGYVRDSAVTVAVGEVVLIESLDPIACPTLFAPIYAKMVIDSIRPATRQVFLRITGDPNCGFRSLIPGVPTN